MYWHRTGITAFALAALWATPSPAQITGPGCANLPDTRARFECMARSRQQPSGMGQGPLAACNGMTDIRARMECQGRAHTARMPAAAMARPAPQSCNFAAPCTDSRGRYYLSDRGQKVYFPRR